MLLTVWDTSVQADVIEERFNLGSYHFYGCEKCVNCLKNRVETMDKYLKDLVKDLNVKVFNLMSRTNETRHIKWHETCKCKCRLDASVSNNKQQWNKDKCKWECKELIHKVYEIKDIFGILVIVNLNVINHVILVSI